VVLDGLEEPARKPIDSLAWSVQRDYSIKIDEAKRKTIGILRVGTIN
jgi:hypothetical protein